MSQDQVLRRESYGPKSRVVGERGARTRQHIVEVTLRLFADQGFHETSVDDIAKAAEVSRATLYQYFESKDDIFVELLDECGSALMRVVRRLGPLGPTAEGFDNLHWWLGEWAYVYDKYATMFRQWAHVDTPSVSLPALVGGFLDAYAKRIADRLDRSQLVADDTPWADGRVLATALAAVVHRVNYFRHSGVSRGLRDEAILDTLAVTVQLVLFPDTPPQALASVGLDTSEGRLVAAQHLSPTPVPRPDRFDQLSDRALGTVRQILDAAGRTFAARGYHGTNVDHVVSEAGLARGTFYKYFRDKLDLLTACAEEAAAELREHAILFEAIEPGPDEPAALRAWVREFLGLHQRYAGVIRVWIEDDPSDPVVRTIGIDVSANAEAAFHSVLGRVTRPYPFNLDAAGLVLFALLDRVPVAMSAAEATEGTGRTPPEETTDSVVETIAWFIERGLLNGWPGMQLAG
jgi:AcrR family transcriptional regulator